jgi:hypothetical protein
MYICLQSPPHDISSTDNFNDNGRRVALANERVREKEVDPAAKKNVL